MSEDSASVAQLREAFVIASKKAPVKRTLARQFGKGVYVAINMPWKFTNMMVLQLEKVIFISLRQRFLTLIMMSRLEMD